MIYITSSRNCVLVAIALIFSGLQACNYADKKSNLEKDSVGGDTSSKNVVGGSEAYETKLDEEAADHLKQITYSLLLEYHLLDLLQHSPQATRYAAVKTLLPMNHSALNRIEEYAIEKRVLLPTMILPEQQQQIDSLKSMQVAEKISACTLALKENSSRLSERLATASNNREQDFKTLMNKEAELQDQKFVLLKAL